METIVLGGGCFWCLDASFRLINGVDKVISGYAGGSKDDARYDIVSTATTGHAEVVQVSFDPKVIALKEILDIFWTIHDPTTLNRQGNDVGPQYRSVIFYANDQQKQVAEQSVAEVQKLWHNPVVTEVRKLDEFYPAEDYHQNYFENNPEQGYCQIIINPKLQKLREKFAERIRR